MFLLRGCHSQTVLLWRVWLFMPVYPTAWVLEILMSHLLDKKTFSSGFENVQNLYGVMLKYEQGLTLFSKVIKSSSATVNPLIKIREQSSLPPPNTDSHL